MVDKNIQDAMNVNIGMVGAGDLANDSFSIDSVLGKLGGEIGTVQNSLKADFATLDPNDSTALIKFQSLFNKLQVLQTLVASVMKATKDVIQGIIQKF